MKLYVAVLKFLIAANGYYRKGTDGTYILISQKICVTETCLERALESGLQSARTAVYTPPEQIKEEKARVDELAKLMDT